MWGMADRPLTSLASLVMIRRAVNVLVTRCAEP